MLIIDNLYEYVDCFALHYLSVWKKSTIYLLDRSLLSFKTELNLLAKIIALLTDLPWLHTIR